MQILILLLPLLLFAQPGEPVQIFLAGDSTMSIKDPAKYPETGWGMPFAGFFAPTARVENRAMNGRSTKTFVSEGRWQKILDDMHPGDYVFIQFGHNDESKHKVERYTTPDEYRNNLMKFVGDVRDGDGIPVLLTPVGRRSFDDNGNARETHAERSPIVRDVATEMDVVLIDADELSTALYQELGFDRSGFLFLQLKPGEHPNYPDGVDDNTHFNELGARLIAQLMLAEVREKLPELAKHIVEH